MPSRKRKPSIATLDEERYRLAFEATGQGFWDWDVRADQWYFSDGFCAMLGYPQDDLQPSRDVYLGLVHPDDRAAVQASLDRAVADGRSPLRAEFRVRSREGRLHWVLCRGRLVRSADSDEVIRLLGVHIEISQRRAAEQALRQSEDRYRMLVESQGEGIGIVDVDEVFTYANPAAERTFGVASGCLTGRSLRDFVAAEDFVSVANQTDRRRSGTRDTYELPFTRADGRRRTLLVTATPQLDPDGKYLAAFGVFRDITDRKQMENALREGKSAIGSSSSRSPTAWRCWCGMA